MNENDAVDRVWDIIDEVSICMVTTIAAQGLRSRPMHALADRDADCIWFITDTRGAKEEEIAANPRVCLAFADVGDNTYLSVTGRAVMMRNAALAQDLWSGEAQAWWPDGPADPSVRVLRVIPEQAEYWDRRGNSMVVALKLAAARLTGQRPDLDQGKKVQLR
jgi:general stress protein 26